MCSVINVTHADTKGHGTERGTMKKAMKSFGLRVEEETKLYYEQEAESMGVTLGCRIRRILKQHMDAEKRSNANSKTS